MFLLLACASITVSGCNEKGAGGASHFKEFTFTGTADQTQKDKIREGIQNSVAYLRSIVEKTERHDKTALDKADRTGEATIKFLDDPSNVNLFIAYVTSNSNNNQTTNGITIKQKTKTETKQWDGGEGVQYTYKVETTNGNKKVTTNSMPISTDSTTHKHDTILGYLSTVPTSYSIYTNSDGSFTAVQSSVNKTVSGVQWGSETKESIVEYKTQTVYSISKDYRLASTYSYEERAANKDQSTGEWLSSVQVYYRNYVSYEYKYGTRERASIKDLYKLYSQQ